MTPEDRLDFCKTCQNKQFDFDRGITCKLTNEKPTFEISCPDYKEIEYEAKIKEREEFKNTLGIKGLFEANTYPTSNWWVNIFIKNLPKNFEITDSDFHKFLFFPVAALLVFVAFVSLEFSPFNKLIILSFVLLLSAIIIRFAWRQLVSERMTIATLDNNGIDIWGLRKIFWEEVIFVYVNTTLTDATVFLKVKERKEPYPVKIDAGFSVKFFVTLIEAYRKNKTGKTNPVCR